MQSLSISDIQSTATKIRDNVGRVIVGKGEVVGLALVALLCEGHILFEDVPGIGKTTLAKALARSLGCVFRRIQFTPDLLPSDVTGLAVYNQKTQEFEYRPGPLMARAGDAGLPRHIAETPYEFLPRLQRAWPDEADQVRTITEAYVAVHYGEREFGAAEVNRLRGLWKRVEGRIKRFTEYS